MNTCECRTTGPHFQCAGCNLFACMHCERPAFVPPGEFKTIGFMYCDRCDEANAATSGIPVEQVRASRAARLYHRGVP